MFRIKNVRNATVAKQSNITKQSPTPHLLPTSNPIPNITFIMKEGVRESKQNKRRPLARQLIKKEDVTKKKLETGHRKIVLPSKNHQASIITNKLSPPHPKSNANLEEKQGEEKVHICKEGIRDKHNQKLQNVAVVSDRKGSTLQISQIQSLQKKQNCEDQNTNREVHIKSATEIDQTLQKQQQQPNVKNQIIQEERQKVQKLQKQRRQKESEEANVIQQQKQTKKQSQSRIRKQQQQEQHAKLKEMMDKVNARRAARQQERERRMQMEKEVERQAVGGIVTLSDPLAHVQMTEAVMDAQVAMLLNMRFAGYPNKEQIERQVEQLQRINCSYMLVRSDPNNPLIKGLANFRVQLFNRVGELIMEAQSALGPTAAGLQVMHSHSRNYPQIKGMQVTRGLAGHASSLLKTSVLKQAEECAICLVQIQGGESVYDVACGHLFHSKCLQEWLDSNANCPACRFNIKYNHS